MHADCAVASWYSPWPQAAQVGWLVPGCDLPSSHAVHCRSLDKVGACVTLKPALHVATVLHATCPCAFWYSPWVTSQSSQLW